MNAILSCRHMEVGTRPDRGGRAFYCRCAVGDQADRDRMAGEIGEMRRQLMRQLADGIMEVVLAHAHALGAAKGHQLAAGTEEERSLATIEVHRVAEVIRQAIWRAVTGKLRRRLDQLSIEPSALFALIDAGVGDYERNGFAHWRPGEQLLRQLPPDVAAFLSPASELVQALGQARERRA